MTSSSHPDAVWFLDSLEGTLSMPWPDAERLQQDLNTPEGQDRYLLGGLVIGAYERGQVPGPLQVLRYSVDPAFGGAMSVDNLAVYDHVVASSICGQQRRQTQELPPGTQITGVQIEE